MKPPPADTRPCRLGLPFGTALSLLSLICLAGCGSEESSDSGPQATSIQVKQVDVANLPIGNPLPPGVSKELRVSAPKDWTVPGRQSGYIAWFLRWDSSQVPLISLKDGEATFSSAKTIVADNIIEYAESVTQRLADEGKEPLEEVVVIQLNDHYFVRYVLRGRVGGTLMERQLLETQVNGKTYLVELRVLPGKLLEYRDAGYAVAASLEFLAPETQEQQPPSPEDALKP